MTDYDDLCQALTVERFSPHRRTTTWEATPTPTPDTIERQRVLADHASRRDVIDLDERRGA